MALETEIALYNELLPSLLTSSLWKIAVIKGRDFLGVFDTMDDAYEVLLPKYGFVQCLMRQVRTDEPVIDMRCVPQRVIREGKSIWVERCVPGRIRWRPNPAANRLK